MEKQARKRQPASRSDEEDKMKSARARTLDDDVEEFFAIIRRIRGTSRLSGNAHRRNPSFQAEDFAACCEGSSAAGGGSGRREAQSMSGREEGEVEVEAREDNGIRPSLSLNVGSCGGGRHLSMKWTAGGSETEVMDARRCISGGSY